MNRAASSGAHGSICRKYLGGTEKESCFFLPLSSQKSRGKNQPLFVSPLPSSNKNGPLFFTHLDGRGAVLCLSRGSGERRLRPLGSEEAEETTVPTSCALSFFTVSLSFRTVSLSLLSPLLYSFFPEFSLCSTIWFFLVFVGGVDITPVFFFFFFLLVFFSPFWEEVVFENDRVQFKSKRSSRRSRRACGPAS